MICRIESAEACLWTFGLVAYLSATIKRSGDEVVPVNELCHGSAPSRWKLGGVHVRSLDGTS